MKSYIYKAKALTITELLVDLLLTTFVIGVIVNLYTNYKKDEAIQFNNVLINNNAIAAYNYIKQDLQLLGFYGCNSSKDDIEYATNPSYDFQLDNPISAYEAAQTGLGTTISLTTPQTGWSPAFQGQVLNIDPDEGSDIITVRFANTNPTAILQSATTGGSLVIDSPQHSITANEMLLISDCLRTVVFQVQSYNNNTITPKQNIGNFNRLAEIYKININTYYIKTANNLSSLYKYSNNTEQLLVPNIENMQLLYGQDTNNDGVTDILRTANNLSNHDIKSIEIGLLIKSNNTHTQISIPTAYKVLSSPTILNTSITINTPNDKYFRKAYDFGLTIPNT
jgi:type IV pilus assembly protein PilW